MSGFCLSALGAITVSVWMVGMQGIHQYFEMMTAMSVHLKSEADSVRYAARPLAMLNLRGLFTGVFGQILPHVWVQMLIALSSVLILVVATKFPRTRSGSEISGAPNNKNMGTINQFSLAVLAASLVSYHFNEHDASILIIPVVVALASFSIRREAAAVGIVLGMLAGLAPKYGFVGTVPVLALFAIELQEYNAHKTGKKQSTRNRIICTPGEG